MRKVWKGLAVLAACMTLFTACGKEEHGTVFTYSSPETAVSARFSPGKTPSQRAAELAAMPKNPLTGEPGYPENALGRRPVAVMVNNLNAALPHRGLSQADIL